MVRVQRDDFDMAEEYRLLGSDSASGAVVTFVGKVRDFNQDEQICRLELEHYPGMTEKALQAIIDEAGTRWQLGAVRVIHRIGPLAPGDQIVFVGVASAHRDAAFLACRFIMDNLKTRAPFWKRETLTGGGSRWVDAREQDRLAARQWE